MSKKSQNATLVTALSEECYRFDFFQAVRLITQISTNSNPVGWDFPSETEAVRFRAHASLDFPPSAIQSVTLPGEEQRQAEMVVNFMGLTGPQGALPQHYTETILNQMRRKDHTLREFLDLFNHRLLSLFFRAWTKYRVPWSLEESIRQSHRAAEKSDLAFRAFVLNRLPKVDPLSQISLDLAGLGMPTLRYETRKSASLDSRTLIRDNTLRYFSGLLAQQHRSAVSLEGLLQGYFDCQVAVEQFVGNWLWLESQDQTQLQEDENAVLGRTAVAGQRVWDIQSRFRVQLGPLSYEQFYDFLPVGKSYDSLGQMVRLYAGQEFDFDFCVKLKSEEVPACKLGGGGNKAPRLGWNTWIGSRKADSKETQTQSVSVVLAWQDNWERNNRERRP
jgi:type VI secretion system protein ImpH